MGTEILALDVHQDGDQENVEVGDHGAIDLNQDGGPDPANVEKVRQSEGAEVDEHFGDGDGGGLLDFEHLQEPLPHDQAELGRGGEDVEGEGGLDEADLPASFRKVLLDRLRTGMWEWKEFCYYEAQI